MGKAWHVYVCDRSGRLYTGMTTDLSNRMRQHKATLLYSESFPDKHTAARREKEIKRWNHDKKMNLVNGRQVSLP